jgi:hypothetical protein
MRSPGAQAEDLDEISGRSEGRASLESMHDSTPDQSRRESRESREVRDGAAGGVASAHRDRNRRSSQGGDRRRNDIASMGIETLSKELGHLSADMERDIGKVYRKYERLERTIRAERDRKLAALTEPERLAYTAGNPS